MNICGSGGTIISSVRSTKPPFPSLIKIRCAIRGDDSFNLPTLSGSTTSLNPSPLRSTTLWCQWG